MTDGNQPADLPLPENAVVPVADVIARHDRIGHKMTKVILEALAAAAPALRAQGAAAEREHRGECCTEAERLAEETGYELGRAAEREAIRQLAIDKHAIWLKQNDRADGKHYFTFTAVPFADLLAGDAP